MLFIFLADVGDKEFKTDGTSQLIWAMGRLDDNKEPAFHDVYPRGPNAVELGRKEPYNECYPFTRSIKEPKYVTFIYILSGPVCFPACTDYNGVSLLGPGVFRSTKLCFFLIFLLDVLL